MQDRPQVPCAVMPEEIAHRRAHEDEPGNARLGELDVISHEVTVTPRVANSTAGRRTYRKTSTAITTLAAMVSAPTATWATVNPTITAMGCGASIVAMRLM